MRARRGGWGILLYLLVALEWPAWGLAAESGALDRAAVQAAHKQGNYAEVLRLATPHAQQGDAYAQYVLGLLYDNGQGVPQDHAQSLQWYLKAAQQGYAAAQFSAGLQYDRGRGTGEDPIQAFRWYREAASTGT